MKKVMISAGEVSGDLHGSKLIEELKKIAPETLFFGMGSEKLSKAGMEIIVDVTKKSTIGFIEPLFHIPFLLKSLNKLKNTINERNPDLIIAIDYQGFNIPLLKYAKSKGIKTCYYISPQEWQWGTEEGGKKAVEVTDQFLSIFKEEEIFYNNLGGNAVYIGHPLIDYVSDIIEKETFIKQEKLNEKKKILSIFPGSRPQEIKYTFPTLLKAAKKIVTNYPEFQCVVSIPSENLKENIVEVCKKENIDAHLYQGNSYHLIASTELSLTPSGTITLEHALIGTPCIVAYKFNKISFWIIKTLMGKKFLKKVTYISLPNIFLKKIIVPEFLQEKATVEAIYNSAHNYLSNPDSLINAKEKLKEVQEYFGEKGAVKKAARIIKSILEKEG